MKNIPSTQIHFKYVDEGEEEYQDVTFRLCVIKGEYCIRRIIDDEDVHPISFGLMYNNRYIWEGKSHFAKSEIIRLRTWLEETYEKYIK